MLLMVAFQTIIELSFYSRSAVDFSHEYVCFHIYPFPFDMLYDMFVVVYYLMSG